MPFRVLYLARHGRSQANAVGQINGAGLVDHLDRVGYRQRVGLFALLRQEPLAAIYVSTLPRTEETAMLLAREKHLLPRRRKELDEFAGGIFEGICKDLFHPVASGPPHCDPKPSDAMSRIGEELLKREAAKAAKHPLTYRAPGGGESVQDVLARLRRFLTSIPPDLEDKAVLLVGHGGTNRFLLGLLLGLAPWEARKIRQRHDQVFRLTRTSPHNPPRVALWQDGDWHRCDLRTGPHGLKLDCSVQPPMARPAPRNTNQNAPRKPFRSPRPRPRNKRSRPRQS